jgi:hypothetical protein
VAAAVIAPGTAAAASPKTVVASDNALRSIGALRLTAAAGLRDAIRSFGTPTRLTTLFSGNSCRVNWAGLHVTAEFNDFGARPLGSTVCSSREGFFQSATLGAGWRTSRGLRVGAPTSAIRLHHPAAAFLNGSWWLVTKRQVVGTVDPDAREPVLSARVSGGRVTSLFASIGTVD